MIDSIQDEDGILDYNVTVFQTCALPISLRGLPQSDITTAAGIFRGCYQQKNRLAFSGGDSESTVWSHQGVTLKIGRASCRTHRTSEVIILLVNVNDILLLSNIDIYA